MGKTRLTFVAAVALTVFSAALLGQAFYGSLVGTVVDASGGAVSGATVTAVNNNTGERRTASTDADGSRTGSST